MPLRARFASLWRNLFRRAPLERELDAELDAFLDQLVHEKMAAGLRPEEARRAARLEVGGVEQVKEQVRRARAGALLEETARDLLQGGRLLRRQPGFTVVAVATLALGIGVSAAIFSVADAVLFRPLPFRDPRRLVTVYEDTAGRAVLAWSEFTAFVDGARTLEAVAAIQPVSATVLGGEQPEQVSGALVSAALFPMLGVRPLLGRGFLPREDRAGGAQVALLSEGLWRRAYGADPGVVGRAVTLEVNASWGRKVERSRSYTVVGVVPASFQPLLHGLRGDVWLPLQATPDDSHDLFVVARMRPGTAPEQVRSDLEAVAAPLRASVHSDGREMRFTVLPLIADLLGDWRRVLLILLGAVGCMLLIACVNVASLALARGRARRGEMAIRAALGAGRARLARQLLTETLLLAGVGGGLAVLVARGGIRALVSFAPPSVPRLEEAGLDLRVLAFMAGVVLLATALAGLWPALGLARTAAGAAWRQGERRVGESRRGRRARGALVAAEMALAIVLLVGSGLMLRTLAGLLRSDPGFDARSVLSFRLSLPGHAYPDGARTADFYERFFAAVATLPGVEAVGVNHALPFGGLSTGTMVSAPGSPASSAAPMGALWRGVSPDYFRALRIPLRRGSAFQPADARPPMRKAIIDEGLARRLWGERDPVGEQIVLAGNPPLTVIGVVGGIRETSLDQDAIPTVYLPFYPRAGGLVVRGGPDAAALAPAVRELLAGVDRLAAASDFQAMAERVAGSFALQRFTTLLLGIFAGAAALIGLVGLYGVVSYSVSQRVRELGVRAALGARRADLVRLVIGQGAFMVAAGVALGLAGAAALARLLAGLLFGVEPVDPLTFAAVPAGLAAAALLACVVPASRAARLDPVEALRHD